jgi:hypothetical protein
VDLPELYVTTVFFAMPTCAICDRPCEHEDEKTGVPYPGGYDKASVDDSTKVFAPICDACVERHYPERVAEVEAARLHYWTN